MNYEKLKETRMKIAYNIMQGLVANEGIVFDKDIITLRVSRAFYIADEVLKQGGYDTTELLNDLEN